MSPITIFFLISYVLLSLSLMKLFEKAGEAGWKGLVPGLNFVVWNRLVGRPSWKVALLLVPIVNIFVYAGMAVDMVRSFGRMSFGEAALAVIYAPFIFWDTGRKEQYTYQGAVVQAQKEYHQKLEEAKKGKQDKKYKRLMRNNPYKKSPTREWAEAIIFAVFAAAFIRMFLIEAYKIPTSSMEGSLLVGDFLFVSKAHYGIRTPQTVLMIPLLHNIIPGLNTESYLTNPHLKPNRLPALESIDRNDPIVFNYPEGDSVYVTPGRVWSIYDVRRKPFLKEVVAGKSLRVRPVDKRDHYIKRCIAAPGDTLEIRRRQVYLNGQKAPNPKYLQFRYLVKFEVPPNEQKLREIGVSQEDEDYPYNPSGNGFQMMVLHQGQIEALKAMDPNLQIIPNEEYLLKVPRNYDQQKLLKLGVGDAHVRARTRDGFIMTLTQDQVEKISGIDSTLNVQPLVQEGYVFPHDPKHFGDWNMDNYGPIVIPKAGATVSLRPENISLYDRIIRVYEGNTLRREGDRFLINGVPADSYTFQQDYYWGMGDNRHNSEDSRVWGFVPADHIVGKPLFVWMSIGSQGIRWNRIFTGANKMEK